MADQIDADTDPAGARASLGLAPEATTIALLPGSRVSEVSRLAEPMIEAVRLLRVRRPGLQFVAAAASEPVGAIFRQAMRDFGCEDITLVPNRPRQVMAAGDVVLCASGTATLETMLVNRPLVMVYRIAASTFWLVKNLRVIKRQLFALPNILAGEALVPELVQDEATGERMAAEIERWLDNRGLRGKLRHRFNELHSELRCEASERAANAVSGLLDHGAG
jgi:lipid-A-disaccharide synthase